MTENIIKMTPKDHQIIEALINLENLENIILVYEEDITNTFEFLEIINKNKKKIMTQVFFRYRNFMINDIFFKINILIKRYQCQHIPTERRLRSNQQKYEKYDKIMKEYVPKMKEMTKSISNYVSNHSSNYNSGFRYENAWNWDHQLAYY